MDKGKRGAPAPHGVYYSVKLTNWDCGLTIGCYHPHSPLLFIMSSSGTVYSKISIRTAQDTAKTEMNMSAVATRCFDQPWNACGVEESSILTHVKWKCFVQISSVPRH